MLTKMFEIRDAGTLIAVMATKLAAANEAERFLLAHSGYGPTVKDQGRYVIVCKVDGDGVKAGYDVFGWPGDIRTMRVAHKYINDRFDELESGAVIDVQFLLGERDSPKLSEAVR